ncbi:MAG: 30S ribosomal protein S17, partial [Candidatus Omnitrophica bacterium]|nr:30S ribosomal protein S17 [Candidatus Omnitrophota bacterium]
MGKMKLLQGVVTSTKMQKTIVVRVLRLSKHPKYGKITKSYCTFKVHDEKQAAKEGDKVAIIETRPLSKDKRYRLVKIVKHLS